MSARIYIMNQHQSSQSMPAHVTPPRRETARRRSGSTLMGSAGSNRNSFCDSRVSTEMGMITHRLETPDPAQDAVTCSLTLVILHIIPMLQTAFHRESSLSNMRRFDRSTQVSGTATIVGMDLLGFPLCQARQRPFVHLGRSINGCIVCRFYKCF